MKRSLTLLILILVILPTLLPFFNNKFFYTQDHIFIARLQQISTALFYGQFPVRWAPDLRYGEPLFNYYAPLPYYFGAMFYGLGFNFIWIAKILFILSAILSAVTMYILANHLFGKNAGFLAAVLYSYAPYRAVDMYVRGALSETWAFIFFPLIFYSSLIFVERVNLKNLSFLSLSLAGLFLTHNVTTLMFLPFLVFWWVYLGIARALKGRGIQKILYFCVTTARFCSAGILAVGLAAFFLLPAFFETDFIQTEYLTVGYFNFRIHFVAWKQFFSLFWGYGSSLWGPDDGLSFQIGLVHLAVMLTGVAVLIFRKNKKILGLLLFLGISFFISIFLQHSKSDFIWEAIPAMAFIQFPWRFLAVSIFIISITGAVAINYFKINKILLLGITVAIVLINLSYFRPKEYVDDSFFDKFLSIDSMHRGVDLTKDYLPVWVQDVDGERFDIPRAEQGEIQVSNLQKNSTSMRFSANVKLNSIIEAPITYFPGWEVRVNNELVPQNSPSKMGLIRFELPAGNWEVAIRLRDTLIKTIGNIVSLGSILLAGIFLIYRRLR